MQRLFSRAIEQRAYEEQPQDLEVYQKETLVYRGRRQLGEEPPMHSRSVVKILYNKDIVSR
jgi:hypothetical protein